MNRRVKNILSRLKQKNLDGLVVTLPANISYLTGYPSQDSKLLLTNQKCIYLTDSRYTEEAKNSLAKYFSVKQVNGNATASIAQICESLKIKNLGFEEKYLTFFEYQRLTRELPETIGLVPTQNLIEELRQIKNPDEIGKIRKATQVTKEAFDFIKGSGLAGKTEIEIASQLEHFIRINGADKASFNIIVASGPNSSYAHHLPCRKKISKDETVLIDMGVEYSGYKSDLTRVFFSGKIPSLARKIYAVVIKAQELAINRIKPGVAIKEIDAASRQYITRKGYGGFFNHNLGHGIGLEVHEAPNIAPNSDKILQEGMIFTVEPAIYLPLRFGIRIEDIVLVTKKGKEVISGALNK